MKPRIWVGPPVVARDPVGALGADGFEGVLPDGTNADAEPTCSTSTVAPPPRLLVCRTPLRVCMACDRTGGVPPPASVYSWPIVSVAACAVVALLSDESGAMAT